MRPTRRSPSIFLLSFVRAIERFAGAFFFFFFFPLATLAQTDALKTADMASVGEALGATSQTLPILIARGIRAVLSVLGIVTVCIVLYAGYLYFESKGDPAKTDKAKKILKSSAVGLLLIFLSFTLTTFILNALLRAVGLGNVQTTSAQHYTEPLSGSLGSGIVQDHYPARNAISVPRNVKILVTFKEPMDPASFIQEADGSAYDGTADTPDSLRTENIRLYETERLTEEKNPEDVALESGAVRVTFTSDLRTFVFDPVDLLGNATEDVNYAVKLEPTLLKADGNAAFVGAYAEGYEWTFEVSTEVDLTPPQVVSVLPAAAGEGDPYERNSVVQMTFNEAMDPVTVSGKYDPDLSEGKDFTRIEVVAGKNGNTAGTFSLSNGYRTVEFISDDACSKDPCGNTIYCLPSSSAIQVKAHAATLGAEPPQASVAAGLPDGLVDACGNSLDGNKDGIAQGPGEAPTGDDVSWSFWTNTKINDTVPAILSLSPSLQEENVGLEKDVSFLFSLPMQSSTLNSQTVRLVPNQDQEFWFRVEQTTQEQAVGDTSGMFTTAKIKHAPFWESFEGEKTFYYYYPAVTNGVKSLWQICLYPSYGPSVNASVPDCAQEGKPYCCEGLASAVPCVTREGNPVVK